MGSWNQTCMVSNMPIVAGEPVVSIFLARRPDEKIDDHCYAHAFYDPLPFLIYGEYNDYGAVENFCGEQDDIIQEFFRRNIIEMKQGENEYHDIAVTKDKLEMELLYDYDHENRLFIDDASFGKRCVDHVQIKRSLFDKILQDTVIKSYEGSMHEYVTFDSLMHNIDSAVRWLQIFWEVDNSTEDEVNAKIMRSFRRDTARLINSTWHNIEIPPVCAWLRRTNYHDVEDLFVEEFCKSDFDRAKMMLIERIKFSWFEMWLSRHRHTWTVPTGVGSQSQEMDGHVLLAEFMLTEAKNFGEDFDDWDDEEQPKQLDMFGV